MNESYTFQTNPELLQPPENLVAQIQQLLRDEVGEIIYKLPQLKDLPLSIRISRQVIDKTFSIPTQSISASIIVDENKEPIPFAGFTATIEPDGMTINISAIYSHLTREVGFSGKYQLSGLSALLSTVDEAVSKAVNSVYQEKVLRTVQTKSDTITKLLELRNFKKVSEEPDGLTRWTKSYE